VIDLFSADYREAAAAAGDAQLLLNILRAKDSHPIHFTDLSVIHGSIQWTAGASSAIPLAQNGSATPTILTPVLGAQNSPTFDMGTLDTQDFTKGILNPIDPKIIKQLFDQGVDPRVMMLLFFSEYENSDKQRFLNNLSCDPSTPGKQPNSGCLNRVYDYLGAIDRLLEKNQVRVNLYVVLKPVGGTLSGAWSLQNLGELRQLDATKYKLIGKQLYSISETRLALCYEKNHILYPLFFDSYASSFDACNNDEVIVVNTPKINVSLPIRSTYQVIMYLGQILRFQEEKGNDRCVTLDQADRTCDSGEVLFQVNSHVGTPIVGTKYGDQWYAINDRPCVRNNNDHCDYSLQVLAILELLLNENKAAKDIISIPRVQVVP
jgi:hypothetical protein